MGSRKRPPRTRPIRLTLAGMVVIPLVSLVALWGFAASVTLGQSIQDSNYNSQYGTVGRPAQTLGVQLAAERLQSFIWLSSGRRISRQAMDAQRAATNKAVVALRHRVIAADSVIVPTAKPSLEKFISQLGQLNEIRGAIDAGTMDSLRAFQAYNGLVDTQYQFYNAGNAVPDVTLYRQAAASLQAGYALELAGREATLVGGALAAGGHMSRAERELFGQIVANQRYAISNALAQLNPSLRAPYARVYSSPAYSTFKAMEDRIAVGGNSAVIPVNPKTWQAASQAFISSFIAATNTEAVALTTGGSRLGNRLRLRLGLAGGLGLIAVIASIFLLLRYGRRITRELTALRAAALTLAEDRLPKVVERLRSGLQVDVATEAPPFTPGTTREIADLAHAYSSVQRTAVDAAVGQAKLREGVGQVFLNLARRNQSLLHRQLDMLDSLERGTSDPETLASFFRIDHLTTRMRRHAESLIILSGEVPGRGWRSPVQILDVLRAAVAEVEDYVRVDVVCEAEASIVGAAVADVIHLLAELVENATVFSPPNTRVIVSADAVGNGFAIEVEDRGLGIEPAELADINMRLLNPPEFDLADSDRLGLFVVGQLAARHQIKVSLRESPFGGTSAIALLPHSLIAPDRSVHGGPAPGTEPAAWSYVAKESIATVDAAPQGTGTAGTATATNGPPRTKPVMRGREPTEARSVWPIGRRQAEDPSAGTYLGLPRRVRQASLAPQLRDGPPLTAPVSVAGGPEPPSPEDARARMVSMQRGWQRGRTEADAPGQAIAAAWDAVADTGHEAATAMNSPAMNSAANAADANANTTVNATADTADTEDGQR
ncbi:MAG: nitrate- and nitrite sensing domain-containing protein [Micromonosporaceae bacterium]